MGVLEIVLLIAGGIVFILSFILSAAKDEVSAGTRELAKEEIKSMVTQEMDGVRGHVDEVVQEAVSYAVEKTERSLDRLTNEKIMAVNEYSDTVLKEIHKNHEEAMFLYEMLNSKQANLKDTVSEAEKAAKEVAESRKEAEAVVNTILQNIPEKQEKPEVPVQEEVLQPTPMEEVKPKRKRAAKAPVTEITQEAVDLSFIEGMNTDGRNSNEKILELYKQGKSNVAIAKELGLGVGEVKLVIGLYKNM